MRLLYAALDQTVPGTLGGSVHVHAVADGLARLGHEIHVATQQGGPWPDGPAHWHAMRPPLGNPALRWARAGRLVALARTIGAEVVMERYYNFGGEGLLAAHRLGLPAALEVNAPVVDYPGSAKSRLDKALLFEPMRRWRDRQCRMSSLFITPTAEILPSWIDRRRIAEVEWGADVDRFHPGANGPIPFATDPNLVTCVFAGAFRSWHGAVQLGAALSRLHQSGDRRFGAVLIGDGPERAAAGQAARDVPNVQFTGSVPHDLMPSCLAAADIGVAPFDPSRHGPLQLGFYWSPLKVFEYMAAGLPVVAPALPRLERLIESGKEGVLYDPREPRGLDRALVSLADPAIRKAMGAAARARVVRDFSWTAHCRTLEGRLKALVAR